MKKLFVWVGFVLYQSSPIVHAEATDKAVNMPEGITMQNIVEMLTALVLVTVVIFVCAWLLKKLNPHLRNRSYDNNMKVLARLPLGTREQQLVVIEAYKQYFLLGVTPNGVSLIKELNNTDMENVIQQNTSDNKNLFQQLLKQ